VLPHPGGEGELRLQTRQPVDFAEAAKQLRKL